MDRLIVITLLYLFCATTVYSEPNLADYEKAMRGPLPMFQITARCDSKRLSAIEASLKEKEKKILFYKYTIFLKFKNAQLSETTIMGMDFGDEVKDCIKNGFFQLANPVGPPPEKGLVPIEIAFPVIITPKGTPISTTGR